MCSYVGSNVLRYIPQNVHVMLLVPNPSFAILQLGCVNAKRMSLDHLVTAVK